MHRCKYCMSCDPTIIAIVQHNLADSIPPLNVDWSISIESGLNDRQNLCVNKMIQIVCRFKLQRECTYSTHCTSPDYLPPPPPPYFLHPSKMVSDKCPPTTTHVYTNCELANGGNLTALFCVCVCVSVFAV